jgi:hypothetical protein
MTAESNSPVTGPIGFARMTGSSIAAPDAAAWVTDFLNAAYYRRADEEREVDDLRLAFSTPPFTRGYVTVTDLVTPDDPKRLRAWFRAVDDGLARYRLAGSEAQHAFWGQGDDVRKSMLHQLALRIGA